MDVNVHSARRSDGWEMWSRLRLAIIGLVLWAPIAIMSSPWLQWRTGSRTPAFPEWSWTVGDLKRYPSRFELEFNLALPGRVKVASLARRVYVDRLRASPVAEVVLGTHGWLYYVGPAGEKLLDRHVRGREPLSQDELDRWREFLLERARRFRSIGARYVFVIAPNKESIYPEYLPEWIGPSVGPSHLDQLMAHMKSATDVTVIDLRPALLAEKKVSVVYFKADTHWNTRGAYAAYREITRVLAPDFPALTARSWRSLGPTPIERTGLDMARMIGLIPEPSEADFVLDHDACGVPHPVPIPIPADLQSRLTAPTLAYRCDAPGGVDAVLFQDSFGTALTPILAESFRSTTSFRTTAGTNASIGYGMPEKLKANLVVEILAERSIGAVPVL
jgi:alginate O-acetyltransferase complex protein AlgJ